GAEAARGRLPAHESEPIQSHRVRRAFAGLELAITTARRAVRASRYRGRTWDVIRSEEGSTWRLIERSNVASDCASTRAKMRTTCYVSLMRSLSRLRVRRKPSRAAISLRRGTGRWLRASCAKRRAEHVRAVHT